jgi:hypothetical protein
VATTATASFTVTNWDEQPATEDQGVRTTHTKVTKKYTGDIEGGSEADMIMAYGLRKGSAAYVGFDRMSVSLHGRSGTFLMQYSVTASAAGVSSKITVVPDSGTGELTGLRGEAQVSEQSGAHTIRLEYELG